MSAGGAGRVWNGQSPEDRRRDRRARLLDAGLEIMGTQGGRAVTIRALCRQTHISERHFYELFTSKDEFLAAVYDSVLSDGALLVADLGSGSPDEPGDVLRYLLGAWIEFIASDPRRGRIIAVEGATNAALARRGRAMASQLMSAYLDHAGSGTPVAPMDPAEAEVVSTVLFVGMWGLLMAWQGDDLENPMSQDELVTHLVALITRAQPGSAG